MSDIKSTLIAEADAGEKVNKMVLDSLNIQHEGHVQYMVMETQYNGKTVYVACAGGEIDGDQVTFTPVGLGAVYALCNLEGEGDIWVKELGAGETLQENILQQLAEVPEQAKVCFVGDVAGKLNGKLNSAFNLNS